MYVDMSLVVVAYGGQHDTFDFDTGKAVIKTEVEEWSCPAALGRRLYGLQWAGDIPTISLVVVLGPFPIVSGGGS